MDPVVIRAVERFRRAARTNAPTREIAKVLIEDLKDAGFSIVAAQQAAAVDLQAVATKLQTLADFLIENAARAPNTPAPTEVTDP
jgi:hypothetical protein